MRAAELAEPSAGMLADGRRRHPGNSPGRLPATISYAHKAHIKGYHAQQEWERRARLFAHSAGLRYSGQEPFSRQTTRPWISGTGWPFSAGKKLAQSSRRGPFDAKMSEMDAILGNITEKEAQQLNALLDRLVSTHH